MNFGAVFLLLLALAIALQWVSRRDRAATRLPTGRLVYADTTKWRPVERPLFSPRHRLTGRPDYLIQHKGHVIPVEIKSGLAPPDGPYDSHVLQLAAYCLLVEEEFGRRPPYGLVVYADDTDQAYQVDYTTALENALLAVLNRMRDARTADDASRDHEQVARCRGCSYRYRCDQSLA